ncbi:PfkB family carbohydrate kinase [Verrucomicrobium spinosum]|uniref:PfkB family carbohydrate kinase n=2 Tax=Verrucomicrobium spinosum TaxID=2736 RepID=UPI0001745111|nr:PfkB family carbohydrate kinase [Verrucomicrobium spinosum]
MSLIISGSVAIDNIKTQVQSQEGLLGGSAPYASLSARLFGEAVHLVGVVGHDFPAAHLDMLTSRGINLDSLERNSGESFTWTGEYHEDMNNRSTLKVGINVLENWLPKLSPEAAKAKFAVLANMSPDNQLQTLEQCTEVEFVAADTMDLWINIANERLHDVMKKLDLLVINDGEAKQFAETTNLIEAGRRLQAKGPKYVVVKRGEHGSFLFGNGPSEFFACSAYPLSAVHDPTGAGDSFLGGMIGWLAANGKSKPTFADLRTAVAHGSVAASFTCEAFSTQRLQTVTLDEVKGRLEELRAYTSF